MVNGEERMHEQLKARLKALTTTVPSFREEKVQHLQQVPRFARRFRHPSPSDQPLLPLLKDETLALILDRRSMCRLFRHFHPH